MADTTSTESVENTETAEVETETEDTGADLEDSEVSFDEADDTAADEAEGDDTESESEETETEEVEETEEVQSEEDKQKAFNKTMAEKRIRDKQEREARIRQEQDEYVAAADPDDPRDLALRQLQVDAYTNKVTANENKLTSAYQRAVKDFAILDDPDPAIQARVSRAVDLFQASSVTMDAYGNATDVRGDLYAYLQTEADSINELAGIGARKQIKSKAKERSKAITTPVRQPKTPKKDPDLDGFDEEAARW